MYKNVKFKTASENWKKTSICDIYFSEQGTLLFLNMEMCVNELTVSDANTLAFALSETSMAFSLNYCEGKTLKRSIMEVNGKRYSDTGEKLSIETEGMDIAELIWGQLGQVLGKSFWEISPQEKAYRYHIINADVL